MIFFVVVPFISSLILRLFHWLLAMTVSECFITTQWVSELFQTTGSDFRHFLAEYRNMTNKVQWTVCTVNYLQTTGSYFRHILAEYRKMVEQLHCAVFRKLHKRSGSSVLVRPLTHHFHFHQKNKPKSRPRLIDYTFKQNKTKQKHSNNDVP